jgi:hypothetical protein
MIVARAFARTRERAQIFKELAFRLQLGLYKQEADAATGQGLADDGVSSAMIEVPGDASSNISTGSGDKHKEQHVREKGHRPLSKV